jgi:hypothetical protein
MQNIGNIEQDDTETKWRSIKIIKTASNYYLGKFVVFKKQKTKYKTSGVVGPCKH